MEVNKKVSEAIRWSEYAAQYPEDQYNVLVAKDMMQAASALQKLTFTRVELDVRVDEAGTPVGCDVRKERDGKYSLSKVGALKVAEAANISIVNSRTTLPRACERCRDLAKAIGESSACGGCDARYNVAYSVTIRVPDITGGFKLVTASKEYDYCLEKTRPGADKVKGPMTYRDEITEGKAFMRALCDVLGLQWTYSLEEIAKPFVVARSTLNLENPSVQRLADRKLLSELGRLVERRG